MIFAGFSLVKFLGGFALWRGDKLGKMLQMLVIVFICLFVFWKLFVAPTQKTVQRAGTITNITEVKEEAAFELVLIPPKVKLGSFAVRMFQK